MNSRIMHTENTQFVHLHGVWEYDIISEVSGIYSDTYG